MSEAEKSLFAEFRQAKTEQVAARQQLVKAAKPVAHFTRTRGPYEARFSEDQTMAIVDDEVVDLAKGKVVGYGLGAGCD
nr:hypothetical protein [Herbaspirillum sp. B39]